MILAISRDSAARTIGAPLPCSAPAAGADLGRAHEHAGLPRAFQDGDADALIRYIKAIRLHQARLMMIRDDLTAAAASARVGYESPSHFNREFKRFFGRSPGQEARDMKTAFSLRPPIRIDAGPGRERNDRE